jgi:hypothetical protein
MTTAFAQRFRAAVDSLTRPRIEVMPDVCVSATSDAPDRAITFMSFSNSEAEENLDDDDDRRP